MLYEKEPMTTYHGVPPEKKGPDVRKQNWKQAFIQAFLFYIDVYQFSQWDNIA